MNDDLRRAIRTVARLARVLERSGDELSLPQYRVLDMVARGDERASMLSARLALAKPTITAVVDGLVERGWLVRSEVAGDRRAIRLSITPAGKKALRAAEVVMADRLRPILERAADPEQALAVLSALEDALDQAAGERASVPAR